MAFYAGRLVLEPAMENPTLVVLTDRNDLDDQLFGTFARCHELLRQKPEQAQNRDHLRALLQRASGGVIFTIIHKFFPSESGNSRGNEAHTSKKGDQSLLTSAATKQGKLARMPVFSERRNIVVIADEAHRREARLEVMEGKTMIVCMSRRICVELYNAIVKLRPQWNHARDEQAAIKIIMTGSASDPLGWQEHIRNKPRREALAKRFKNPQDPLKIVLVRDMWLTGFDAPCLHTMYRTSRCGATG